MPPARQGLRHNLRERDFTRSTIERRRRCNNFVPVSRGEGKKVAPIGDIFDQPSGGMSWIRGKLADHVGDHVLLSPEEAVLVTSPGPESSYPRPSQSLNNSFMPPVFREWPHSARARRGATTLTHTGVYATRAVGLKTQPTRTGFMPPVFREWPHSAKARRGATTRTRAAGFETHLRIVIQKDPRHLFAVPTAREPLRYRVWMLGRALKLTREHLAVAPCTKRVTPFLYH